MMDGRGEIMSDLRLIALRAFVLLSAARLNQFDLAPATPFAEVKHNLAVAVLDAMRRISVSSFIKFVRFVIFKH